jgi:hypothetical protein
MDEAEVLVYMQAIRSSLAQAALHIFHRASSVIIDTYLSSYQPDLGKPTLSLSPKPYMLPHTLSGCQRYSMLSDLSLW